MTEEKPKRGRPKMDPANVRGTNYTMRLRYGLRDKLATAAKVSGRSMSQEAEARLEASFDIPAIVAETLRQLSEKSDG